MVPDATHYPGITAATYREAVMALMDQDEACVREVAARMGVSFKGVYRYLRMTNISTVGARPHRFPEQYLVCKMLDQETRERIMQPHHWAIAPEESNNGTRSKQGNSGRQPGR